MGQLLQQPRKICEFSVVTWFRACRGCCCWLQTPCLCFAGHTQHHSEALVAECPSPGQCLPLEKCTFTRVISLNFINFPVRVGGEEFGLIFEMRKQTYCKNTHQMNASPRLQAQVFYFTVSKQKLLEKVTFLLHPTLTHTHILLARLGETEEVSLWLLKKGSHSPHSLTATAWVMEGTSLASWRQGCGSFLW